MSGRLVISRHKSYHVWNQDNVEKVMRDERVHRERLEAEAQRERDGLHEKTREILLADNKTSPSSPIDAMTQGRPPSYGEHELFTLFGDVEVAAADEMARKVKRKEEEAKHQLLLKQNGAAPWAFADGSSEQTRRKTWYETLPGAAAVGIAVMGRVVTGQEAASARARDSSRKRKLDPMAFCVPYASESMDGARVCAESKDESAADVIIDNLSVAMPLIKHDGGDSDKDRSKHRKKKSKRGKEHRHGKSEPVRDSGHASQQMQELRRRRLEREKLERKKTAMLLTEYDIYGAHVS